MSGISLEHVEWLPSETDYNAEKLYRLAVVQGLVSIAVDGREVDEHVLGAVVGLDEPITLVREELDGAPAAVSLALHVGDDARARCDRLETGRERRGGTQAGCS